ncbi:hypothetical protein F5Y06DRAFT_306042 [Hypoxylon sp. FL0890]|nr:hypothetical protein F5Y06DRAFT_306042 [Hypoxylon sp. FL0890]
MKLSITIFAAAAASGVLADFWVIYLVQNVLDVPLIAFSRYSEGAVFARHADFNCERDTGAHYIYPNSADVSGDKLGMRTVPGQDVGFPFYRDPLDVVEFNTGSARPGHHTIYKDRGYAMVDLDGKKTGQCFLNRTFTINEDCYRGDTHVTMRGSSMFFCKSDIEVN